MARVDAALAADFQGSAHFLDYADKTGALVVLSTDRPTIQSSRQETLQLSFAALTLLRALGCSTSAKLLNSAFMCEGRKPYCAQLLRRGADAAQAAWCWGQRPLALRLRQGDSALKVRKTNPGAPPEPNRRRSRTGKPNSTTEPPGVSKEVQLE
jgi:hypothetical protein